MVTPMTTLAPLFKRLDGLLSSEWHPRASRQRDEGFADVATTSAPGYVSGRVYGSPYASARPARAPLASRLHRAWADFTGAAI